MPTLLCPTPKIGILITMLFCFYLKTNISIFWVQPLIYSFRQISILCWHNRYSFCWSLLPWASLKHGQRCPGLFKDGRKATWPCIIWLRQLCSWLSHLNYNHKKDVPGFIDTKLRAGTRNRFLILPWVTAKGKQPPSAGSPGPLKRRPAPLKQLFLPAPFLKACGSKFSGQRIGLSLNSSLEWLTQTGTWRQFIWELGRKTEVWELKVRHCKEPSWLAVVGI